MGEPFEPVGVNVVIRAERPLVQGALRALIDDGALVAREGLRVFLVLEEILPHLGAYLFEQKAQMRGDGIIAQYGVARLEVIMQAERGERAADAKRADGEPGGGIVERSREPEEKQGRRQCEADETRFERLADRRDQSRHGAPHAWEVAPPNSLDASMA